MLLTLVPNLTFDPMLPSPVEFWPKMGEPRKNSDKLVLYTVEKII